MGSSLGRRRFNLEQLVQKIAEAAGLSLNGQNPWDIQVHDDRWYERVFRDKSLGLGESYMDGWWDCGQLDEMICRILGGGATNELSVNLQDAIRVLPGVLFNLQSSARARMVAEHHYDLDNDLFHSFLDSYRQYSCGYFEGTDDLDQAQRNKLTLIAEKLELNELDHVLDIGCGWGGFARFAAERYGCAVTAVNISQEQLRFAREFCAGLPVTFLDCDYRDIEGRFSKIVSVGMFEHVGYKNYRAFMEVANRCLEEDGIFLLHTIGSNKSLKESCDPWIRKYIFPNSYLPSIAQISKAAEGLFVVEDWHNLGPHYDRTLLAWNDNFQEAWPQLEERYDERFKRMWEYYLLSCAGSFRARSIQLWQVVMTMAESGTPQPRCRVNIGDDMREQTGMERSGAQAY
ncbi:MAG: cyclopropane fatty acyl phospholipid synthase [Thermoleophilia bacterium]